MPILSERGREWISSKTGQEGILNKSLLFDLPVHQLSSVTAELNVSHQNLTELPDEDATHNAIDSLYHSSLRFSFPAFERSHFQETLTKAYGLSAYPNSNAAAKACVWAVHAVANHLQYVGNKHPLMDGERCVSKSQALLGLVGDESSLDALQAVLLLVSKICGKSFSLAGNNGSL